MQYKTLIVDGPYLSHKSYAAPYRLTTPDGLDATMIHGFIRSLNARRKEFNPNKIIVAWESHGTPSWRKQLSKIYKPGKQLNKQFISSQEDLKILLQLLNVPQYMSPTNEADDVIARLTTNKDIEKPILIYTPDKDIMQLIDENCHTTDGKEIMNLGRVKTKFGVWPKEIPKYLAIVGDVVDNIKGIDGIGPKKAAKYIYATDKEDCPLRQYKNKIEFNEKLTTLNWHCPLVKLKTTTEHTIETLLDKYRLKSIKEKLDEYKKLGTTQYKLKGDWI